MRLRDGAVDVLKRGAIALLHQTVTGEALLLRIYLVGEEQAEMPFLARDLAELPPALAARARRHRQDEARHATLFRERLTELTGATPRPLRLGALARWKLARFHALAEGGATLGHPWAGQYAVAWREEEMAVRVLERHVDALERRADPGPTLALLRRVLADERAHVAMCRLALETLVPQMRRAELSRWVRRIDNVDRAFGVTGALALFLTGAFLCAKQRVESSIWPWRTRAAT